MTLNNLNFIIKLQIQHPTYSSQNPLSSNTIHSLQILDTNRHVVGVIESVTGGAQSSNAASGFGAASDSITTIPRDRWDADALSSEPPAGGRFGSFVPLATLIGTYHLQILKNP